MNRLLDVVARFCVRRHWLVIGVWIALLVGLAAAASGAKFVTTFNLPGTSSQTGLDLLQKEFPGTNGGGGQVVLHVDSGTLVTPSILRATQGAIATIKALPSVSKVTNPFSPSTPEISSDLRTAVINVTYSIPATSLNSADFLVLSNAMRPVVQAGASVAYGGAPATVASQAPDYAELYGLGIAVIVLLVMFGSVFGMIATLLNAILAVATSTLILSVLARFTALSEVALTMALMIGLGVGIDYSLFIVTRARRNLQHGRSVEDAVAQAVRTSGYAVAIAGGTVAIALLGLGVAGIPFVFALGWGASIAVLSSVIASVVLLPAILGAFGSRLDRFLVPGVPHELDPKPGEGAKQSGFSRWAHLVARRPWLFGAVSLAAVLTLAVPVLSLQLGQTDAGNDPPGSMTRRAYDEISQAFGPGFNGPVIVVLQGVTGPAQVDGVQAALKVVPGVQAVLPAQLSDDGSVAQFTVVPTRRPVDPAVTTLVQTLRSNALTAQIQGTPTKVYVTGQTAVLVDLTDRIAARMPWFILAVICMSFLLLLASFRSVAIAVKAAVMNVLSICAAYGVVIAVFQWGWGLNLMGVTETVPIVAYVPMMMFAILFGLSMDYEVFLMSRIVELHHAGFETRDAVADGLAGTARVITAAALIMIGVFASFISNPSVVVKMMGLGLAVAVAVDATIVRMVLVPATMEILGNATWWMPKWLDRILPNIAEESDEDAAESAIGAAPAA